MTIQRINDCEPIKAHAGDCLRDAMRRLDQTAMGIVLLCESDGRLLDTITDGDVRRAILDNVDLDAPLWQLYGRKVRSGQQPVTANATSTLVEIEAQMILAQVKHLPLVDENQCVVGLARDTLARSERNQPSVQAVVMAGGFGTRLRPLTDNTPKPMLPVGGKPLLERTVARLRDCGIRDVHFTTHYLPEQIQQHFGNGSDFGVDIRYVAEEQPLGTAGSLNLVRDDDNPLIVINGDILTAVDFSALIDFHNEHDADMTVGVRQYEFKVPYGVIESEGGQVRRLKEKPKMEFLVNAGIYLVGVEAKKLIPADQRFDMTDLIEQLIADGKKVVSFPVIEYWLDIGQHEDFEQAQLDIQAKRWAA
ncbi:dTDP-glucose pyrophosphorylase/CBS domain-containing protein [Rhodopirellula rubra]|uniref:dTDP-glucose pyrophosphorylase/CBS domain-containing protein n=1 Tax=Aporhodopirellula rubra TaxID=980271 RepID=A0A7W5H7A6_9BACT|nr:nucleotidyltransferase family protein [Aporhodopirellula rubra]MBB3207820.1 dTDP-glucose pyrophosphorylase/CBS domain-containing protein [Aporhodopirellula rubra]